ncbi:MAG: hypothetical protein J6W66_06460 [Lachnospiraceae bacterium]|nr:hypothetical protein [Lachnospiraceae bacterium]MBP5733446.1 hypothetical protein [Lachnospiraceae bacterium]
MEILLILIIVIIFGAVLTGNLGYVLFGMSGFLLLMAGLMVVTFFVCCLLLLTSKWKEAKFVGLDTPKEGSKFKVAYYLVDGEEIPCLFPEEGVFRKQFYQEDKVYHVLLNKRLHRVFDRFSVATCLLGLFGGLLLGGVMLAMYY